MSNVRDSIDDILSSFKDRFTNPLVFAFICSWLGWNWRIVLALLWNNAGIDVSLISFVEGQLCLSHSFFYPLLTAIGLVTALPLAKIGLQIFLAYINRRGTNAILYIKREGSIPVRSYLKLRKDYTARTEQLIRFIEEDTESLERYRQGETELINIKKDKNELERINQDLNAQIAKTFNERILDGWWINRYTDNAGRRGQEHVFIDQGKYYVVTMMDGLPQQREHIFNIVGFSYLTTHREMTFVKELTPEQKTGRPPHEHFNLNILKFDAQEAILSGTENRLTKISYSRTVI